MLAVIILITAYLAVARLTRLLTEDRITVAYRRWVVNKWGENSMTAYLAHCPWCTSMYIAAVVMPLTWIVVDILTPEFPWWLTLIASIMSIPAASHVAGLLNRE